VPPFGDDVDIDTLPEAVHLLGDHRDRHPVQGLGAAPQQQRENVRFAPDADHADHESKHQEISDAPGTALRVRDQCLFCFQSRT
jgi:hypothetical protein